jgi:hypothetical protein
MSFIEYRFANGIANDAWATVQRHHDSEKPGERAGRIGSMVA